MNRLRLSVGFSLVFATRLALADCGGMPFVPGVQLFEPNQRAAVAFNGEEEVLLLSTDLRASEKTKVLEVLPLPSEPKVSKGDVELFRKATTLINTRLGLKNPASWGMGGMGGMGGGASRGGPPPAGIVTLQERIGAHDITVTKVVDRKGFIDWVEERCARTASISRRSPNRWKRSWPNT